MNCLNCVMLWNAYGLSSQSCVYSDRTACCPRWKIPIENPWKCNFQDSKFQKLMFLDASALKILCLWCEFQGCLLFIISLLLNPLSPSSDQHQFSPMISIDCQEQSLWELIKWSQSEKSLIFYQILSTNSIRKCIEISLENLYVDIGA